MTAAATIHSADRWRPSRAGLVALWRYLEETFEFHRGRLLLRGPNGAGKSMALELLLPFLLDADASPSRLTSAAKSRGGLYDRVMTGATDASRVGYAWVEFARGVEVFTVGARLRGSQASRKVDVDYFTTSQAVGRDLQLLDGDRTPLSRKALVEAVGDCGRVHASADEHRAAVRAVLYPGFGAERYASVIGALLALRKEKLSQNLDLPKLSQVLTESLPPLDDHDIAAVAEGFERLDRRRAELEALEVEVLEVRQLARSQRDYGRAVVVGVADAVRKAETARDQVTRAEREATEQLQAVETEQERATTERASARQTADRGATEISALKDTDAYRSGAALDDLRRQGRQLRQFADRARETSRDRESEVRLCTQERDAAVDARTTAAANEALAAQGVAEVAVEVDATAATSEAKALEDVEAAEALVNAWVESRRAGVGQLRAAMHAHERSVLDRDHAQGRVDADELVVDAQVDARAAAASMLEQQRDAYGAGVEAWASSCTTFDAGAVALAIADTRDPASVATGLSSLRVTFAAADASARADLEARGRAAADEQSAWEAERTRWSEPDLVYPDAPGWRTPRDGRLGAPLWALVDVRAEVDVDRLEAALVGAGLLDAWVEPDGRIDLADRADLDLAPRPVDGDTLLAVLEPADDQPVAPGVVAAVLSSIRIAPTALADTGDDDAVVIGRDGTFRLGAAYGRGATEPARQLGAVARERHRLERLVAVDAELARIGALLQDLGRERTDLDRHRVAVDAELNAVPSAQAVIDAGAALLAAGARLEESEGRLTHSRAALRQAEDRVRVALRELATLAAALGLPTGLDALAAVDVALTTLRTRSATWMRRRRELDAAATAAATAASRLERAAGRAAKSVEEAEDAEREAAETEARVTALESAVAAGYRDVLGRIEELHRERTAAEATIRDLDNKLPTIAKRVGQLTTLLESAVTARVAAETARAEAQRVLVAALRSLGDDAQLAPIQPLETATAVLAAARELVAQHPTIDVDSRSIDRLSDRVRDRVHHAQGALGGRYDIDREQGPDGWWELRTVTGGLRRPVGELAGTLAADLERGRSELADEEERLFEQTLAGSVRRALADRIRQANALVDGINEQLGRVRTAAGGVEVRLRWEVDPEQLDAVKSARSLLLRDPADLTDAERASLQAFVRARVDQARVESEVNAPWEARLRETLDYRAWHRFTLRIAHRDWDGFQPATPTRLQRLSTGERSIALHLPMIASVAAHYATADGGPSTCPRLILLDELFAGVDTANRAQLFGTFTAWDLDAVFTSDHEWCQYATLDGIAIHHLHPPAGDEPVTSTRFTWDGHERRMDGAAS